MIRRGIPPLITVWLLANVAPVRAMDSIQVSPDARGFLLRSSGKPFTSRGLNYGDHDRLIEDFWNTDWAVVERDFAYMKSIGANVVRVHLQFGKFMDGQEQPHTQAFDRLTDLPHLAERTGLYLYPDLTGPACHRTRDVPPWYDRLDESARRRGASALPGNSRRRMY